MITSYENDFQNPKIRNFQFIAPTYQKWLNVGIESIDIEKVKNLNDPHSEHTVEKNRPCNNAVDELSRRLEWTSLSSLGRLLDRKLLPIEMTKEEQKQMNELLDSEDFNFVPCLPDMEDKPLEAAVRLISSQIGIEFDNLMKDVYEQREQWHLSAIGQTVNSLKNLFEEKKKKKMQAEEEKKAAAQRKRQEEELERLRNVVIKPQSKRECFGGSWFNNTKNYRCFCMRKNLQNGY